MYQTIDRNPDYILSSEDGSLAIESDQINNKRSGYSLTKIVIIIILLAITILVSVSYKNNSIVENKVIKFNNDNNSEKIDNKINNNNINKEDECDCPDNVKTLECSDTSYPVLGGVDFVNYFTKYKTSDGLVDETQTGELGSIDYSSVYNGYTFYFTSAANKELFDQSPSSYIPQYGGFCSWGIVAEYGCPRFPWSNDCLGPNGNWSVWTIYNGKIYFFLMDKVKDSFLLDPASYVANGDERWAGWFSNEPTFSTKCYSN